jgi:mono/diheme cytochrome c family protein
MIALVLFLAFWVVIALALVFVGIRGGPAGARAALHSDTTVTRNVLWAMLAVTFIGFGVVVPLLMLTGNNANASKQYAGVHLNASEKRGRTLFGEHCGVCHTLAAPNAVGKVGPNLDTLQPPKALVLNTIANGCLQNAPTGSPQTCLGQGTMPANLVQGRDANDVAAFVARVAGK